MTSRIRIPGALALAMASLLALAGAARADQAYDKVATVYAQNGGRLDPCAFTQTELQAAVRGIPPTIRNVVPALRTAMLDGIAAHMRGDCKGIAPTEEGTIGGAGAPGSPTTTAPATTPTTPPVTTTPTQTAPAVPVPPATTQPPPVSTTPAPAPAQPATAATHDRDRTPLLVALVAVGVLLLLALLLWSWARMRGWDPTWGARMRHAWGEAGFRTTSTWAEFTDWLRLGR